MCVVVVEVDGGEVGDEVMTEVRIYAGVSGRVR